MKPRYTIASLLMGLGASACIAHAQTITTTAQFNSGNVLPSPITAVSGDLLETSVASAVGEVTSQNLRNGTTGTAGEASVANPANVGPAAYFETFFNFDVTTNTLGYTINEILVFSGWTDSRAGQVYDIFYSVVGDSNYTVLTAVGELRSNGSLLTRTVRDNAAPLATGVDSIQFRFYDPSFNAQHRTVYREIDVLGAASIPEPSAALLGGLGLLALLRRRRG